MSVPAYSQIIMSAQTVDETVSTVLGPDIVANKIQHAFYVEWSAGVASGVVQIESASHKDYAGTWAPVVGGNIANGVITFAGSAPNGQYFYYTGAALALRARISTVVTGGTVTVTYIGNA